MKTISQITPAQVGKNHDFILLDVREQNEWDFVHLPGAVHLPLNQLPARFRELPADRNILCLCHHGMRSQRAAQFLAEKGFEVSNLSGGIDRWALEMDPSLPRY